MAYIGKTPVIGNFVKLDAITVVNGQAAYTMQNGGVNFTSYDNVNQFLVSLNGVLQAPTDSFTVSGSTLTFASNLSTGDVIDFVLVLGNSLDIGTPSDNTVTTAKLADSSVSLAKLTATGTKDATTFLRGDNTFAEAGGGKINQVLFNDVVKNTTTSSDVEIISKAITPSSTSSKILIIAAFSCQLNSDEYASFDIYRGSLASGTKILDGGEMLFSAANNIRLWSSFTMLDSPSTTSATTYTIVGSPLASGTIQFGAGGRQTITLMEVLA
jgi:hypothetical protein